MPYPSVAAATSIAPGTPIGNVTPGSGAFTTLSTSGLYSAAGPFGQIRIGAINQGGRIQFIRGSDGTTTAGFGYMSTTEAANFSLANTAVGGSYIFVLNRSVSGIAEGFRFDPVNDGSFGIGVTALTARLHLPAGAATAGRAPAKFTSGPLLTITEVGALEFLNNDLHYTGTDAARRRLAVNGNVITFQGFTVAGLPAGTQGNKAFVTDALAPTYLTAVVGGGSVVTEVFYNGTAWVCT